MAPGGDELLPVGTTWPALEPGGATEFTALAGGEVTAVEPLGNGAGFVIQPNWLRLAASGAQTMLDALQSKPSVSHWRGVQPR